MSATEEEQEKAKSLKYLIGVAIGSFGITQLLAWLCACDSQNLNKIALAAIGIQLLVYMHASGLVFGNVMTEKFYDLTGSCTYITLILGSLYFSPGSLSLKQKILSMLVVAWAARLGSFLFARIVQAGGVDSRFVRLRKNRYRFLIPWIIQGVWVFFTAMPIFIISSNRNIEDNSSSLEDLTRRDFIGMGLWLIGFVIEVTADTQKQFWRSVHSNEGKFINSGLWSLSRHPNYFGEMLLWIGYYIAASGSLQSNMQLACAAISPIFVCTLLIKVSGINLLEKAADTKWGDDAAYKKYKQSTPVLIPLIGRAGNAAF